MGWPGSAGKYELVGCPESAGKYAPGGGHWGGGVGNLWAGLKQRGSIHQGVGWP